MREPSMFIYLKNMHYALYIVLYTVYCTLRNKSCISFLGMHIRMFLDICIPNMVMDDESFGGVIFCLNNVVYYVFPL